ncbi:MAG: SurA N-terminal domain-containing protein [Candidatus Rokuibacteriota bacterium]
MIGVMRRYRKTLQIGLLVVVAAFIASLFVFGTQGFGDGERSDAVATVNGETISAERFQRRYQDYLDAVSAQSRERFSPQLAEQLGLPQQVLSMLVQEALVVQRARAEGLEVSDEELSAQIQAARIFHEGGRFSMRRYEEFLRRRGMTASAFETEARRELTRTKMEQIVKNGVKVTEAELEQAFAFRNEEVRAAWALVETAPLLAAATAGEEDIARYYKEHGDELRQPERRRVQYVTLAPRDFSREVPVAEIEKHYAEHRREFELPRQAKAAHVLVRVPEAGGSEGEDKARARVADVIRRAKAGEDFAKLAAEVSEDPGTKSKGGELGWVGRGEVVPQFEDALFKLKKGEVTLEPVRTPFGFHAIRVVDVREAGVRPLKEVADQIRAKLVEEGADRAARAKADEVRGTLLGTKDFMAEARRLGLTPIETTIAQSVQPAGGTDTLESTAFGLTAGGVSAPVTTPAGWVVLKAIQTIPAGVPPLAEVRDRVVAAVKQQKSEAAALEKAQQIVRDAASGDLLAVARKAGAQTGETRPFSRAKPAERLPGDAQIAALRTPTGGLTDPVKTPQGVYVLKVLERVPAKPGDFAAERERLSREVLAQKQSQAWEAWLTAARAGAKIERNEKLETSGRPRSRRG